MTNSENNTSIFIMLIVVVLMTISFNISRIADNKDKQESKPIVHDRPPSEIDVLFNTANKTIHDTDNLELCKTLYPQANYHYIINKKCVILEWIEK